MRQPTNLERDQLDYYFSLDIDSLWVALGRTSQEQKGVQFSAETAMHEGKCWFKGMRDKIFEKVCIEGEYCMKMKDDYFKDHYTLAVVVGDLILGVTGSVPVLAVASLLTKIGLDEFCECES